MRRLPVLVQYLYFVRIPLIVGSLLVVLAFLSLTGPSTIRNLMITTGWGGLAITSFLSVFLVALCVFTGSLAWTLAPKRFRVPALGEGIQVKARTAFQAIPFLAFAVPMLVALFVRFAGGWLVGIVGIVTGVAGAVLVVSAAEMLRRMLAATIASAAWEPAPTPLSRLTRVVGNGLVGLMRRLGPGYYDPGATADGGEGRVEPGHVLAAVAAGILVFVYLLGYWAFDPARGGLHVPALSFVLLLMMMLEVVLAGATFLLDRYRIPLIFVLIVYQIAVFRFWRIDHYFLVLQDRPDVTVPITQAVRARYEVQREANPNAKPVLTVVTASGGGIQAAAWTTRVLTGLQQNDRLGAAFTRSIHLISATSGGSVGTTFFLEAFDGASGAPPMSALEHVNRAVRASSLEATAWGFAYPDFLRVALPMVMAVTIDPFRDRGWAMERAWERSLGDMKDSLGASAAANPVANVSDLARAVRRGERPATIFNATVVESGYRLLLTPLELSSVATAKGTLADRSLMALYDSAAADISTLTAARLSATFPYVTPIARARLGRRSTLPAWHVADGGYFDNFGVMAATEWLRTLLRDPGQLVTHFRRILVVQIRAFPEGDVPAPSQGAGGWAYATLGPARTVLKVRESTQTVRGDHELALLSDLCPGFIESIVIAPEGITPPLSWHLSAADQRAIDEAWERVGVGDGVRHLESAFTDQSDRSARCRLSQPD